MGRSLATISWHSAACFCFVPHPRLLSFPFSLSSAYPSSSVLYPIVSSFAPSLLPPTSHLPFLPWPLPFSLNSPLLLTPALLLPSLSWEPFVLALTPAPSTCQPPSSVSKPLQFLVDVVFGFLPVGFSNVSLCGPFSPWRWGVKGTPGFMASDRLRLQGLAISEPGPGFAPCSSWFSQWPVREAGAPLSPPPGHSDLEEDHAEASKELLIT